MPLNFSTLPWFFESSTKGKAISEKEKAISEKDNDTNDVQQDVQQNVQQDIETVGRYPKRKRPRSGDVLDDLQISDISNDDSDSDSDDDDDDQDYTKEHIDVIDDDTEEYIDSDINKVGGWVYGEEGAFPDIEGILGRDLTYAAIFGKGDDQIAYQLTQEQLDYLVHRWLSKLEDHKRFDKLRRLSYANLRYIKKEITTGHARMSEVRAQKKEDTYFNKEHRRPVGTHPKTLAHKKDRAVCNKMKPVLNHTSCLQKMTTFYDSEKEKKTVAKSQHILFCLDQLVPNPRYNANDCTNVHPKHRDLSVFLLPDHCDQTELGYKLLNIGYELCKGTNHKVRIVRDKESYFRLVFGKAMDSNTPARKKTTPKKATRVVPKSVTQKRTSLKMDLRKDDPRRQY
uniref:Uncharacterized protein n=1 Tax=Pseudo-nitzschia australis TaxID=44445 RepID=A0A6V0ABJ1_9STRA